MSMVEEVINQEPEVIVDTVPDDTGVVDEPVLEGNEVPEVNEEGTEPPTMYTQEQVESAVKTRVGTFNRKIEKLKAYETAVKKISEVTGLSVDNLINRLGSMSIQEQAKILGITPQQLSQKIQTDRTIRESEDKTNQLTRALEEQKLVADPKFRDFSLYKEEVYELIEDNPKLTLQQAYVLAKGDSATLAAARDAEQRAIAKMTKSSNQVVVKPGASRATPQPKIDAATVAAAKRVGMDPAEYAVYSNISSFEEFEKMKSSKK